MPDFIGPILPPPVNPNTPTMPPNGPTVSVNNYPTATLPGWVAPTQGNNPSAYDINSIGNSLSERILTVSPWGTYVPVIYGNEYIGPMITLIHAYGGYIYMRLVWCVGEIEEIEEIKLQGGTIPPFTVFNHYTGTSSQGIDPMLAIALAGEGGYTDTLTDVGPDNVNLAYTVVRLQPESYDTFPRFVAKIKGLKLPSPVPTIESVDRGLANGATDTVTLLGNTVTATDEPGILQNGVVSSFVRYYEDELIDNDSYTFEIEVLEYNNQGSGTAVVTWAETALLDSDTNPVIITGVGTYIGSATRSTYDATYNALKIVINGDLGVQLVYNIKAYNTLGNTVTKYHETAGLALNHLMTDPTIGLGLTANYASLVDLIHRNNEVLETVGFTEVRSAIGLALTKKREVRQVIEVLRGYARTNINNINGEVVYYPLKPIEASFTITNSDIKPGTFKPQMKDLRDIPNIVRVYYTDLYPNEPRDNFVEVMTDEVATAAEKKREAVYRMPGYRSRPAALRFANDVINQRLRKFSCKFRTHQKVYDQHEGETFNLVIQELDDVSYKMKVVSKSMVNNTEFEIYAEQEDDDIYSNEIADFDPGSPILEEDDPFTVADITDLTVDVETSVYQTSIYSSRFRVTWTATSYIYNHSYLVKFFETDGETLIDEKYLPRGQTETVLSNLQENVEYRIEVYVIGFGGTSSTGVTTLETPTGKDFPPSDISEFLVSQTVGTVTCSWQPAVDNQEVWYYEIQFGPSGFEWNDVNARLLITRIDAFEHITQSVPSGTWDFLIKAVDNAYNQSVNAARASGIVVVDLPELYLIDTGFIEIDESESVGMVPFISDRLSSPSFIDSLYYEIKDWATDNGETMEDLYPNGMNTYTTNPYLVDGAGVADTVLYSEPLDAGQVIDGYWSLNNTVSEAEALDYYFTAGGNMLEILTPSNTPSVQLQLSTNGTTWVDHYSTNISGSGRYARLKITSPSQLSRWIYRYGTYYYSIKAKIKTEYVSFTFNYATNNSFIFERETRNLQFSSISIASAGDYTVTYSPIYDVADIQGLAIDVWDSTGSVTTNNIDLKIVVRYV